MPRELLVSIPEYWALPEDQRPDTYEEMMKIVKKPGGYWQLLTRANDTGEVLREQWLCNAITDNGCLSMFKNTMNAASAGIAVANIIAIDQSLGYTTLSTTIASGGTVTSITVGTLTGPTIPSGTTLCIGAGGATQLFVSTTAAITGAGTYTVASTAGPSSSISSGANIRYANQSELTAAGSAYTASSALTTDVASLNAPSAYTAALPAGQFTISGSGNGNRQMSVSNSGNYLFSTGANSNPSVATAANYTAGWLVNASPVASTANTFVHVAFNAPISVTSGTSGSSGQATINEKL